MTYGLDGLARRTSAVSRSISAENPTGGKGAGGRATDGTGARAAGGLGPGWKISPSIEIAPGATATLADIDGPGVVRPIWFENPSGDRGAGGSTFGGR